MASRWKVLSLYRKLLRESQQFTDFNYRMYAQRRVRDSFKESRRLNDHSDIERLYRQGLDSLGMLRRQTAIGKMYQTDKLVIEDAKFN